MKPENKYVSLELAKKMRELGWDYETERYWDNVFEDWPPKLCYANERTSVINNKKFYEQTEYPAPDAMEIGIPEGYKVVRFINKYICKPDSKEKNPNAIDDNLAETLGQMWCYLKEKNLI